MHSDLVFIAGNEINFLITVLWFRMFTYIGMILVFIFPGFFLEFLAANDALYTDYSNYYSNNYTYLTPSNGQKRLFDNLVFFGNYNYHQFLMFHSDNIILRWKYEHLHTYEDPTNTIWNQYVHQYPPISPLYIPIIPEEKIHR